MSKFYFHTHLGRVLFTIDVASHLPPAVARTLP